MKISQSALRNLIRFSQLSGALCLAPLPALAQYVASDACSYALAHKYTVDAGCTPRAFHKPASFTATYDPGSCGSGAYADAYGWFTATSASTSMTFAPNTAQDPVLHILTGACGALTTVVCADDLGPGGSESISFPTVIGQNYIIRVQTSGSNNAMADGQVCIYPTPPPPPNDEPCHAVFLDATTNCNTVVSSTNTSATPTPGIPDPGCYYGGQPDVWYTTIAPPSGHIYVDSYAVNGDGPGDSGMALYTAASCNQPMTLLVCNDDQDYPTDHMPAIGRSGLVPGDTVYIRFWAYYANEGSFLICASPDGSALPVELTSFTATVENGAVAVKWSTASEKDSDHFTVERSTDNKTFEPIGRLPAAGNSQMPLHYALVDRSPAPGINYYRLAQVDIDGTTERSDVVACMADGLHQALLYPNPAQVKLNVRLAQPMPEGATLWINGTVDRSMAQVSVLHLGRNSRNVEVDVRKLVPGMYFLSILTRSGERISVGGFQKL